MLTFLINNRQFLLSTDTSVRVTWVNPACQFDNIPGDVAMGIDIPVNENNRALLGNPERFERYSTANDREFPGFEIRFGGKLLLNGTLVIQSASAESYNGWVRNNVGNMGKEHREKYIYDIDEFNTNITFVNKANYNPLTDPYGCPKMYNPDFFKDKGRKKKYHRNILNPDWYPGSDKEMIIDETYESELLTVGFRNYANWNINALNPDNTVKLGTFIFGGIDFLDTLPITVVSPMLFLNYVIKALLKDARFFIDNNAIADHDDLKKLIIYNNYDITRMAFGKTATIPINTPWPDLASNNGRGIQIEFAQRDYTETFKYKDLLPKVRLKDFILSVQNALNVCFHFHQDGKVDITDRETILTNLAIDIDDYIVNTWEIETRKDVTLKFQFTHDKGDTFFQERWEDIDNRRDDEADPVDTWNDLDSIVDPAIGEVRNVKDLNYYVQYQWYQHVEIDPVDGNEKTTDMLGWKALAIGFQNGFYNKGSDEEEQIETKFSTLGHNLFGNFPELYQPGNIRSLKFAYQNFSPRILFYLGNNQAKNETANISLDWEKSGTGLLETRWKNWNRFWSNRHPVAGEADMSLNALDYVVRNITSKFRWRGGEFIIEELETEFRGTQIGRTSIKGYKI